MLNERSRFTRVLLKLKNQLYIEESKPFSERLRVTIEKEEVLTKVYMIYWRDDFKEITRS